MHEEIKLFQSIEQKLEELLTDHKLVHKFSTKQYPITLTISQDVSPEAQMRLFETGPDDISSSDAVLQFIFKDGGILVRTDSRLIIDDGLMSKIKGMAKKMHYLFLQSFFRGTFDCDKPSQTNYDATDDTQFDEFYDAPDDDSAEDDDSE